MKPTTIAFACLLAAFGVGCNADDDELGRGGGSSTGSGGSAATGSGGAMNFGNSTAPQAPPVPTNAAITGGDCKAGHYVGHFIGEYMSPLIFEIPIPVEAADVADIFTGETKPGLEFWLEQADVECEVGQEFCFDFKVTGGKMQGFANGTFPFEIDLEGELDCDNGKFQGELRNGKYIAFGLEFAFEGTIDSSYDAANSAFFDGVWDVKEPMGMNAGGSGEWSAGWVMD